MIKKIHKSTRIIPAAKIHHQSLTQISFALKLLTHNKIPLITAEIPSITTKILRRVSQSQGKKRRSTQRRSCTVTTHARSHLSSNSFSWIRNTAPKIPERIASILKTIIIVLKATSGARKSRHQKRMKKIALIQKRSLIFSIVKLVKG
ncbi:hypothetical protein IJU97_00265 [bacterium]|nr:hypothetical protein [bacterium]